MQRERGMVIFPSVLPCETANFPLADHMYQLPILQHVMICTRENKMMVDEECGEREREKSYLIRHLFYGNRRLRIFENLLVPLTYSLTPHHHHHPHRRPSHCSNYYYHHHYYHLLDGRRIEGSG